MPEKESKAIKAQPVPSKEALEELLKVFKENHFLENLEIDREMPGCLNLKNIKSERERWKLSELFKQFNLLKKYNIEVTEKTVGPEGDQRIILKISTNDAELAEFIKWVPGSDIIQKEKKDAARIAEREKAKKAKGISSGVSEPTKKPIKKEPPKATASVEMINKLLEAGEKRFGAEFRSRIKEVGVGHIKREKGSISELQQKYFKEMGIQFLYDRDKDQVLILNDDEDIKRKIEESEQEMVRAKELDRLEKQRKVLEKMQKEKLDKKTNLTKLKATTESLVVSNQKEIESISRDIKDKIEELRTGKSPEKVEPEKASDAENKATSGLVLPALKKVGSKDAPVTSADAAVKRPIGAPKEVAGFSDMLAELLQRTAGGKPTFSPAVPKAKVGAAKGSTAPVVPKGPKKLTTAEKIEKEKEKIDKILESMKSTQLEIDALQGTVDALKAHTKEQEELLTELQNTKEKVDEKFKQYEAAKPKSASAPAADESSSDAAIPPGDSSIPPPPPMSDEPLAPPPFDAPSMDAPPLAPAPEPPPMDGPIIVAANAADIANPATAANPTIPGPPEAVGKGPKKWEGRPVMNPAVFAKEDNKKRIFQILKNKDDPRYGDIEEIRKKVGAPELKDTFKGANEYFKLMSDETSDSLISQYVLYLDEKVAEKERKKQEEEKEKAKVERERKQAEEKAWVELQKETLKEYEGRMPVAATIPDEKGEKDLKQFKEVTKIKILEDLDAVKARDDKALDALLAEAIARVSPPSAKPEKKEKIAMVSLSAILATFENLASLETKDTEDERRKNVIKQVIATIKSVQESHDLDLDNFKVPMPKKFAKKFNGHKISYQEIHDGKLLTRLKNHLIKEGLLKISTKAEAPASPAAPASPSASVSAPASPASPTSPTAPASPSVPASPASHDLPGSAPGAPAKKTAGDKPAVEAPKPITETLETKETGNISAKVLVSHIMTPHSPEGERIEAIVEMLKLKGFDENTLIDLDDVNKDFSSGSGEFPQAKLKDRVQNNENKILARLAVYAMSEKLGKSQLTSDELDAINTDPVKALEKAKAPHPTMTIKTRTEKPEVVDPSKKDAGKDKDKDKGKKPGEADEKHDEKEKPEGPEKLEGSEGDESEKDKKHKKPGLSITVDTTVDKFAGLAEKLKKLKENVVPTPVKEMALWRVAKVHGKTKGEREDLSLGSDKGFEDFVNKITEKYADESSLHEKLNDPKQFAHEVKTRFEKKDNKRSEEKIAQDLMNMAAMFKDHKVNPLYINESDQATKKLNGFEVKAGTESLATVSRDEKQKQIQIVSSSLTPNDAEIVKQLEIAREALMRVPKENRIMTISEGSPEVALQYAYYAERMNIPYKFSDALEESTKDLPRYNPEAPEEKSSGSKLSPV